MDTTETRKSKPGVRRRADAIRPFRCKNLIAVLENPTDMKNIGTVIRNVNALGVEKVYVVDPRRALPEDWQDLRERRDVSTTSVSAVKWTFVRRFDSTDACYDHLERNNFTSIVTSPHVKGKTSIYLHEGDYTVDAKPMFGMIDSLNLGTSSGIVLYEVAKQRRAYQSKYRWRDQRGEREEPLPTEMPSAE